MKHIVGFSCGIDSQATARLVLNRFGKEDTILTNSDAGGWEDPITTEFRDWYSANVHPVVHVPALVKDMWETEGWAETRGLDGNTILTFEEMCRIKGRPPSRKAQFCTANLKLKPQRRWIREMFGPSGPYAGEEYCRYTGVRRDESAARKDVPFETWDDWFDCKLFAPVADWTKQMCFDYVLAHGNRVGCAPCINSSKEDILNWSIRRPEMIEKVRVLEERTGLTFFFPVRRDSIPNKIDEVVAWARTSRGGKQEPFPIFHEREACESKWGLCE